MQSWEIHWNDWVRILLGNMPPEFLVEVIIRVLFIYLLIMFCIRLMGKRMAAQLSRNELVAISSLAASIGIPIKTPDRGLLPALLVAIFVVAAQRILALVLFKNQGFEAQSQGNISILVDDCCLNLKQLKSVRIAREEVFAELRFQGIKHLGQVKRLYFEAQGNFTLIINKETQPGLCVLPSEDTAYRAVQLYNKEIHVCQKCGNKTQQDNAPCGICGNTTFENPMI